MSFYVDKIYSKEDSLGILGTPILNNVKSLFYFDKLEAISVIEFYFGIGKLFNTSR